MLIHKILNNNVIVVLEKNDEEKIMMGRGLAYKKKVGDTIDLADVDKTFSLSSHELSDNFIQLINDIPFEVFSLSDDIIAFAQAALKKKMHANLTVSLTDHIHTAIERFKEGIVIKDVLLWDIQRFYKDEYQIGLKALDMIEEHFNLRLPEDEAGFIAFHILNASGEDSLDDIVEITKVINEITNIVKYRFKVEFDEDDVYFYRFVTHLKFFAYRLVNKSVYNSNEDGLLELIKIKYPSSYSVSLNVKDFISDHYNYVISDEELLYLTIHIERVIFKTK
ncbi:MAG: PRD domain-containing protein [Erysipelothrix sp.]|nr:PRD domain-containing protein [Erysipelothrix sp.]